MTAPRSSRFPAAALLHRLPARAGVGGAAAAAALAGILACAGEVEPERGVVDAGGAGAPVREAAAGSGRVPDAPRDTGAGAPEEALAADRVLAGQGDAGAQARLAEAHYLGRGADLDIEEAVRWARLAAEQGNARGQGVLASAYNTGRGVEQDFEEALRWARLAAEQGDAFGQTVLAYLYANGNGVAQDHEEMARWGRLAAEQGYSGAQGFLGMMYMFGRGVEQDWVTAYMWLTLGEAGGEAGGARAMLDDLAGRMTPEQIAEAEARARDWEPVRSAAF